MIDIILLCSGITKGMKSYGPKAIVPVGKNKNPLIVEQIQNIRSLKLKCSINIVVGFESKKIISILNDHKIKNINFIFHDDYENDNAGGAILKAMENIKNNCIIIDDGIIVNEIKNKNVSYLPVFSKEAKNFNIGLTENNSVVEYLFYDLPKVWSELCYIGRNDLAHVRYAFSNNEKKIKTMFLFEIINLLIDNNIRFEIDNVSNKNIKKLINHKVKIK